MLSLAQIDSEKFRKDCSIFNIKKSIEEVMMIQQHKVLAMGINLKLVLNNLDTLNKRLICTDEQRLQQVLLNIQSNAIKFTPRDGSITISCELIEGI